ncbi:MAG: hypothetical protein AAF986_08945 [Pseudomonadota bacterium]
MRASVLLSILLHSGAAAALMMGLIPMRERESLYVPPVPIEVIRKAELSELLSVPEMVEAPEPEQPVEEEDPAPVEEVPVEEVAPPEPSPEPAPEPEPEPEPTLEPEPEPEPIPEPPKPEPPKPAPPKLPADELDFGDLESALKDLDPDKQEKAAPRLVNDGATTSDVTTQQIGEGQELTIREEDLFRARMYECWNPDMGVPNADELVVEVKIFLNRDGSLAGPPEVLNNGVINRSGNSYWTAARQRALTAVQRCAPYSFLDPGRYENWRNVTFNFDPEDF